MKRMAIVILIGITAAIGSCTINYASRNSIISNKGDGIDGTNNVKRDIDFNLR